MERSLGAGSGQSAWTQDPDLSIAAAAEELDLIVLHYDANFDRVSAVTGQRGSY